MQTIEQMLEDAHFKIKDYYLPDCINPSFENCLDIARHFCNLFLSTGSSPRILNIFGGALRPKIYSKRLTWIQHFVCECDVIFMTLCFQNQFLLKNILKWPSAKIQK